MSQNDVALRGKLAELKQDAGRLSRQLVDAGTELRRTGTPTADSLQATLAGLTRGWDSLQIDLLGLDVSTTDVSHDALNTLSEFEAKLDEVLSLSKVEGILKHVAAIRQTDGTVPEELAAVHRQSRDLRDQLRTPEGAPIILALADGSHPCTSLLRLLREGDTLADGEWLKLQDRIEKAYGPALATASARGKLTLTSLVDETDGEPDDEIALVADDCQAQESPLSTTEAVPLPVQDTSAVDNALESAEADVTGSIFDDALSDERVTGPALVVDRSIDLSEMASGEGATTRFRSGNRGLSELPTVEKSYRHEQGPVFAAALAARTATDQDRDESLSELIVHLVRQDRMGLAYHLAHCLETQPETRAAHLPAWLLHALGLSSGVMFAKGRLAALLEEDFGECHERDGIGLEGDWAEAATFFVRAAALRPSVVAPGTRAAAILRSYPHPPECTELYNYCSRIGASSERLQGLMPSLFKCNLAEVTNQDRLEALQLEAQHWRELLKEQSVQYTSAEPLFLHNHWTIRSGSSVRYPGQTRLWQKWQQTLRLVDGIIDRVLDVGDAGQHEVRTEITRLERIVRVGTAEDQTTTPGGDGLVFVPLQEMSDVICEAMAFGQQWLSLQAGGVTENEGFLPQAAEELRSDVLSRHDAVIDELANYRDRSRSLVVQAGVECLMRSIQRLREMVDPQTEVSGTEPPPRHLLHAELLKMPTLPINDVWEPETGASALSRQIVRFLTEPQPDWATAFHLYCEADDWSGTDRLLELDVWESADQRHRMKRLRDQYLVPTRQSLLAEIDEFERELSNLVDVEVRGETSQLTIQGSLCDLRNRLQRESEADLQQCRFELNALWSGVSAEDMGEDHPDSPAAQTSSNGLSSIGHEDLPGHETVPSIDIFDD